MTPNTPKACLAIDAPFVSAAPDQAGRGSVSRGLSPPRPLPLESCRRFPRCAGADRAGRIVRPCPLCDRWRTAPIQVVAGPQDGVLHRCGAVIGAVLCTSPRTCTHTTQHVHAAPSGLPRIHDSLFFVNGFSCVCATVGRCPRPCGNPVTAAGPAPGPKPPSACPPFIHHGCRFCTAPAARGLAGGTPRRPANSFARCPQMRNNAALPQGRCDH